MDPLILALVSVGVGALLGGVVNAIVARYASFEESKGMARALKAEIDAILALLALRDYAGALGKVIARLQDAQYVPTPNDIMSAAVTLDFFSTYHALAPKIGLLGELSGPVAHVYVRAKGVVEDMKTCREMWERAMDKGPVFGREGLLDFNCRVRDLIVSLSTEGAQVSEKLGAYAKGRFWGLF